MKVTNFKKLFSFLLLFMVSCSPCDDIGGDPEESNYVFYQTSDNIIFRYDYENFLVQFVDENLKLGESLNKDLILIYSEDTIFTVNSYNLEKKLILDNVPNFKVSQCILNKDGSVIAIKTQNNELYKSDILSNLEFINSDLSDEEIFIDNNYVYYWEKSQSKILKAKNLISIGDNSKFIDLEFDNISSFTSDDEFLYFSNFNNLESKIFTLQKNLSNVDTTRNLNKGNLSPIVLGNDLLFYDDINIYNENLEEIYQSDQNNKIVNIYYNRNLNLSFLYIENNVTFEKSIYYFTYQNGQNIENLILLINNAEKVN